MEDGGSSRVWNMDSSRVWYEAGPPPKNWQKVGRTPRRKKAGYHTDKDGYVKEVDRWNADEESDDDDTKRRPLREKTSDDTKSRPTPDELLIMRQLVEEDNKRCYDREDVFLITFDGYHRENNITGGYGAVLWSGGLNGGPLAAVGGSSTTKISTFFHNLEGLLNGLLLAHEFPEINSVYLVCNSDRVSMAVEECIISSGDGGCRLHPRENFDRVCARCVSEKLMKGDSLTDVVEIMRKIIDAVKRYRRRGPMVNAHGRELNRPADYMAKMVSNPGTKKTFLAGDFPVELQNLIKESGGRSPFIIQ